MRRLLIFALMMLPASACSQSLTLANLKGPIAKACGTTEAKSIADLWKQITACGQAVVTPPPSPTPTPTPTPTTGQIAPVPSGLNVASLLQPSWGTGAIPTHDVDVGAFRFICAPGQVNWDDPIVYPGQKNGSPHPHQWFGNALGNYASTYASLRMTGDSTCNNALNRSGYWVQVMMHPSGKMVVPDWFAIYYKRMPANDPRCQVAGMRL